MPDPTRNPKEHALWCGFDGLDAPISEAAAIAKVLREYASTDHPDDEAMDWVLRALCDKVEAVLERYRASQNEITAVLHA